MQSAPFSFMATLNWSFKIMRFDIFFLSSVLSIVFRWHRQRPQREPYPILQMESVQCPFMHWMAVIHFNVFQMAFEVGVWDGVTIPLTLGKDSNCYFACQYMIHKLIFDYIYLANWHIDCLHHHHRCQRLRSIPQPPLDMMMKLIEMAIIKQIYPSTVVQLHQSASHVYQQWANEM